MQKSNSGTMIRDLTTGSVTKQLITFATPLFLSGLLQTLYNMVDMVVVGQFVGSAGLSAVSVGGEITGFLMFIAMGVSNAGQIIISQFIGADRKDDVRKLIGTLFTFLMACSVALTIVCLTLLPQIMQWAQVPAEALGYIIVYLIN